MYLRLSSQSYRSQLRQCHSINQKWLTVPKTNRSHENRPSLPIINILRCNLLFSGRVSLNFPFRGSSILQLLWSGCLIGSSCGLMNCVHRTGSACGPRTGYRSMGDDMWLHGLGSKLPYNRGFFNESNSRPSFTHYKDSLLKVGWPFPPKRNATFDPGDVMVLRMTLMDLTASMVKMRNLIMMRYHKVKCQRMRFFTHWLTNF